MLERHANDVPFSIRSEVWEKTDMASRVCYCIVVYTQPYRPEDVDPEEWPDLPEKSLCLIELLPAGTGADQDTLLRASFSRFLMGPQVNRWLAILGETFDARTLSDAQPVEPDTTPTEPEASAYVPSRAADLIRWRATWRRVRGEVEDGKSLAELTAWLQAHEGPQYQQDTLRKIIKAGTEGLLD